MFRDIELDSEGDVTTSTQSQSVRKNISLKLKGKGRGRGRGKSTRLKKPELGKADLEDTGDTDTADILKTTFNIEEDISKLEAPTFTTIDRGPPEPLHRNAKLKWDHKVNLIGEKVVNPMIHCCEKCQLPILIYGRMIACKHVFCLDCAKKADKVCPRCNDKIQRVEQTGLGTVFMCTYGGSRHGNNGCRRTYLSQRDLQAHINHRHLKTTGQHHENAQPGQPPIGHHVAPPTQPQPSAGSHHHHEYENRDPREMRGVHEAPRSATAHHHPVDLHSHHMPVIHPPHQHPMQHVAAPHDNVILPPPPDPLRPSYHREDVHQQPHISSRPHLPYSQPPPGPAPPTQPPPAHGYASPIPVMSTRTNLITVPIQDDPSPDYHQSPHQNPFHPPSQSHHHQPPPPQQSGGVAYPQQHPVPPPPPYTHPPPAHHPVPTNFAPPVSQPPVAFTAPISTPTFTQPPPSHFPPPLHSHPPPTVTGATNNPPPLYTTPPPGHHPPPLSHSGPPPNHPPFNAPQRFTPPAQPPQFEDSHLSSPPYNPVGPHNAWNPSQPRGPPPIRPNNNPNMGPPQPRPPYYHQ